MAHHPTLPLNDDPLALRPLPQRVGLCPRWQEYGRVIQVRGNLIEAAGIQVALGEVCTIFQRDAEGVIYADVVGFDRGCVKLSPLTSCHGLEAGSLVAVHPQVQATPVSHRLLGRIVNGLGEPIDNKGPLPPGTPYPLKGRVTNPLTRPLIREQLDVGIRSINGLLPIGKGQRLGIFAGSGVGKSTLLGMMARHTTAPVNVIALIGERGREVNEFIHQELGAEGLKHSVIVVATSDQPATIRMRGAYLASTIAEYFRDQGEDVLFMMDSITRFAMAAREVGLAAGEPPTTKGYTPSVFSLMPQLLERAGSFPKASITGLYTVLVEGDDLDDPVADAVRSILDGHIVLSRDLAQRQHFPAIDLLQSVSRLSDQLTPDKHKAASRRFLQTLACYREREDMIHIGAYAPGTSADIDFAIAMIDRLTDYLRQPVEEGCSIGAAHHALSKLFQGV
jgi:flagellum-specific ATP synthase